MGKKKGKKVDPAKAQVRVSLRSEATGNHFTLPPLTLTSSPQANEARKAAKVARNAAKADAKLRKGEAGADPEGSEALDVDTLDPQADDLDSILAKFAALDAANDAVESTSLAAPPPPRANLSVTFVGGAGGGGDAFVLYGGEYYDGRTNVCNSDVIVYDPGKKIWKEHCYQGMCPPPRCSHQAVAFNGGLYVFGGELAGVDVYHHYHDLWR